MRFTTIFILLIVLTSAAYAQAPVVGHNDPSQYRDAAGAHDGAGTLSYFTLLGRDLFETNVAFFHRGILQPRSSIGEHNHRGSEEIYFIFDGPAEFTVNGQTALLPAPATVLVPLKESHGVYNNSDKPLEWMNIAVSSDERGPSVNYGEDLTNQRVTSPAPFAWSSLDKTLLIDRPAAHQGKGTVLSRRVWGVDSFKTKWAFVDHLVLPPDTSIGYHIHEGIEEVYYIMDGTGKMTVDDQTFVVNKGDAIPNKLGGSHGLYNHSSADIEIVVVACAMEKGVVDATDLGDDLSGR
jgi:mannose-6-phosphate isomerase-like protein (cupin superfamily)